MAVEVDTGAPAPGSRRRRVRGCAGVTTSPAVCESYCPAAGSVRSARRFVEQRLAEAGLDALADDAGLMLSELAANAVMHARTTFEVAVQPVAGGARVEVRDESPRMPVMGAVAETAMSGRGLVLVAALATRWGTERSGERGKSVWFEVGAAPDGAAGEDSGPTAEELLAMWDDEVLGGEAPSVVVRDLPVPELLAAKDHMDDLVRELQLVMLDPAAVAVLDEEAPEEVLLARRLDAAVRDFHDARVQVRAQVARAAAEGEPRVTLHLVLPAAAAEQAARYRQVVEEAERLSARGALLTRSDGLAQHRRVRRHYLDEVIRQLGGAPA